MMVLINQKKNATIIKDPGHQIITQNYLNVQDQGIAKSQRDQKIIVEREDNQGLEKRLGLDIDLSHGK